MFKKLINKIIMGTECYFLLKNKLREVERENEEIKLYFDIECLTNNISSTDFGKRTYRSRVLCKITKELESIITNDRKIARKITKLLNANFNKKDETIKQVKKLCNEIIKGE